MSTDNGKNVVETVVENQDADRITYKGGFKYEVTFKVSFKQEYDKVLKRYVKHGTRTITRLIDFDPLKNFPDAEDVDKALEDFLYEQTINKMVVTAQDRIKKRSNNVEQHITYVEGVGKYAEVLAVDVVKKTKKNRVMTPDEVRAYVKEEIAKGRDLDEVLAEIR